MNSPLLIVSKSGYIKDACAFSYVDRYSNIGDGLNAQYIVQPPNSPVSAWRVQEAAVLRSSGRPVA
ncbi:MAG: hypothetical protein O8C67_09365 [Candidatus Methanoperedens sp.]|nr:hypothetical protein [Candidatus Methanoperedens sp.]MCZ7405122.1 hypothetical protein [Candidatus Methanoperedens sp.]